MWLTGGVLASILSWGYWYKLCCKWDNEINCDPPTGTRVVKYCGKADIYIVGPGAYGLTTWSNTNASPATAVTLEAKQTVTGLDATMLSTMVGTTTCINNNGAATIPAMTATAMIPTPNTSIPSISFATTPPQNGVQIGKTYPIKINGYNPDPVFAYTWNSSQTSAYNIWGSAPDYFIEFKTGASGAVFPSLKVVNTCSGNESTISFMVFF